MRNSAVHPALSRETATSQIPLHFSFKSSTPENCASHRAPFGLVANTKALRRSSKLSMRSWSAFVFATNPNGALWDAQFSGVYDLNENWNGIWDVAVSHDSAGWTAEFRIPLLALRFHAGTNPEFGFNVRRFIRRKNEEDLWRAYGRAQGFYRLN